MKWWCVIVTLAVVVAAVKAQQDDYYYDDDDAWDKQDADLDAENNYDTDKLDPEKEKSIADNVAYDDYSNEKIDKYANHPDYQVSLNENNGGLNKDGNIADRVKDSNDEEKKNKDDDTIDEAKSSTEVGGDLYDDVPIEDLRKNDSNEKVPIADLRVEDKQIDQLVQEQINQVQEDLDEPNSETFDDYQIEDNRPDKGDVAPKLAIKDLPSDSDGSFETNDYNVPFETDPLDGFDTDLSNPETGGDVDSQEESPDNHKIIADANNLLAEENGLPKEDTAKDSHDDGLAFGELDENSQEDTAAEDIEQMLESDKTENKIEIESVNPDTQNLKSLEELDEDSQEDTEVEDLDQKNAEDVTNENDKDLPEALANSFDESLEENNEPHLSFVKYKDDMIDPEKVEDDLNSFDDNPDSNDDKIEEINNSNVEEEEDTVDKAYKDLNADLEKLFATWDKLTADDSVDEEELSDETPEEDSMPNMDEPEDLDDLERENTVLRDREQLDKYIDEHGADDSLEDASVEYYNDENIFAADTDVEISDEKPEVPENDEGIVLDTKAETTENGLLELFNNLTEEVPEKDSEDVPETKWESTTSDFVEVATKSNESQTISVTDLTPEQYKDVMSQFAIAHAAELDTQAEDFGKHIAAVHMTLSAEEPIEITSPNFPNTYPTNNVVDWILEGDGTGIELNITDLALRGAQGDFLLVKPGGLDESGPEGLIFSYQLNEPRLYRFTDVSRVFVRFQSGPGLGFLTGFRMTIKNIWPPEYNNVEEDLPEPEPLLPSPTSAITVNLGGITVFDFSSVKDDFQRIIADMATMYINSNGIDAGLNSTSEVTQITSVSSCKANWPNFENCVAVSFAVPLVYEEDEDDDTQVVNRRLNETDLQDMWRSNVNRDPFAARLRAMGISEFEAPNDRQIVAVWVVLAVGIVISAAMVAIALWRYSCFEDYTRMQSYSDTDSLADQKRGLDLYPTPHQNLPPLYAEQDYNWADGKYDDTTRVDLGGFANRSFARDELVDIYSDEDTAAVQRDRNNGFSPRDIYQV